MWFSQFSNAQTFYNSEKCSSTSNLVTVQNNRLHHIYY